MVISANFSYFILSCFFIGEEEIRSLGLYGNYSIPKDNPYFMDKEFGPEVWALGFGNPWRCSFDSERPSHFICGDCGKVLLWYKYINFKE